MTDTNTKHSDLTTPADLLQHGRGTGPVRTHRPVYVDLLPPCNTACPAGENIQAWLALAQAGQHERAWQALVRENPMPAVHGRVCYHPCETSCNRAEVDTPVSIHAIERFLGDKALEEGWSVTPDAKPTGKRILIVDDEESVRWALSKALERAGKALACVREVEAFDVAASVAAFETAMVVG